MISDLAPRLLVPQRLHRIGDGKGCKRFDAARILSLRPSYNYVSPRSIIMAKLIYSAIMSLDGYIEDKEGKFDWAEPDAEVHSFINELERGAGTYLYGRRMYETMMAWEDATGPGFDSPVMQDFAATWKAADKIVYSTTLQAASTSRTRIVRNFDPWAVSELKSSAKDDILIGGPGLAAHAFKAGLVDECHLFFIPILVGGGKQALPDDVRVKLELLDERRFDGGTVYLRYGIRT